VKEQFNEEVTKRLDELIRVAAPRLVANAKVFRIAAETRVVLVNDSVSVAKWKIDGVPDGVRIDPREGDLVPQQTAQLVARFADLEMPQCLVVVFVEGGSPLVLEFANPETPG
jgi:hypothetical protein